MTDQAQAYLATLREAKAAMRAFATCATDDLFQLALQATTAHQEAKRAFLDHIRATAPNPKTDTRGVSQTHCIK